MNTSSATFTAPSSPLARAVPLPTAQQIVDLLCAIIRSSGISDSGAAALAGVHPSTVSRWKREHPDLVIALLQAREQFRDHHLSVIMRASEAEAAGAPPPGCWNGYSPPTTTPKPPNANALGKRRIKNTRPSKPPKPRWNA